ncbi:MAG: T9SS type A sorting domain-containing protein [Phaeodactylibacter sp.]|nr:T9SS type A sorting domain-containing protein [Phaeodactylibacter sp.]
MKKVLLFVLGLTAWSFTNAQETTCDPDQSVPDSVVVAPLPQSPDRPDGGITDTACADEYYKFVFTFNIPATYDTPLGPAPITNVSITPDGAVTNLPASFDYVCNPPNCVFEAETKGCVVLFGTATDAEVMAHDLKVVANVAITGIPLPLELTLPDDLEAESHYYLVVKPAGSANCLMLDTRESFASQFSISNQPNPSSGWTQVTVNAQTGGTFDFVVSDMLGQKLHRERVAILPGENTIDYNGSHLPNGVYLYSLSNGREMVSRKMAINRR